MNIAYLILAHNQPKQLVRLIERLHQPGVYFFVHLDKKSKDYAILADQLAPYPQVRLISTQDINWMGFNMVKATIDLLNLATTSGIHFKYYVLLSGQDYPIKSNAFINDFFEKNETDFMSYNALNHFPRSFADKVRYYHNYDFPYTNPRHQKKIPALVYLYFGIQKRLKKFLPKRRFYRDMVPYFGSQWFALTHHTVSYILSFIKENPGYLKFMRHTEGPDETFFPTIVMNSPRQSNLYDYEKYQQWLKTRKEHDLFEQSYSSLRYMDWSERGKPKPAILDTTYFDILASNKNLFARKFDESLSADLLAQIDKQLLR
jgi:Core-2/I-Branching enzyme